MGRIEWAMWANEQAVIACGVLFIGGTLAVASNALDFSHRRWEIGAYGMAIALFIFILEYPRGKRKKGNTAQRDGQYVVTTIVSSLGFFGRNYFFRFLFYVLACIPCLLALGTVIGGLSLLVTAGIYLRAAVAGEEWIPCERIVAREKSLTRARPPSMAPPRLNPTSSNDAYDDGDDDGEIYENAPSARV